MKNLSFLLLLFSLIACTESEVFSEPEMDAGLEQEKIADQEGSNETEDESKPEEGTEEDENPSVEIDLPQVWKLFKLTCDSSGNCGSTGEDLPYRDTYTFSADFTVKKLRVKDGDTLKIEGDFKVSETEFNTYAFNIFYEGEVAVEDIDIISSCMGREEYLFITEEDHGVLKNSTDACDGPRLYYSQVKE
ncbi:hypothetical protein GCM10023115_47980 [Pontixanthobacter gangjinensis]|uniref:Lipocalin-like domain-containing protein n=1 Tax=Christiangramia aestuarii TaxID=1028746 RepID=A0A7M3SWY0_9FLAO|nr:hypothetical protein [Christiangramia aestuarii]MUP41111.1 hypothetical protein [Christiangramia aestuarii]